MNKALLVLSSVLIFPLHAQDLEKVVVDGRAFPAHFQRPALACLPGKSTEDEKKIFQAADEEILKSFADSRLSFSNNLEIKFSYNAESKKTTVLVKTSNAERELSEDEVKEKILPALKLMAPVKLNDSAEEFYLFEKVRLGVCHENQIKIRPVEKMQASKKALPLEMTFSRVGKADQKFHLGESLGQLLSQGDAEARKQLELSDDSEGYCLFRPEPHREGKPPLWKLAIFNLDLSKSPAKERVGEFKLFVDSIQKWAVEKTPADQVAPEQVK